MKKLFLSSFEFIVGITVFTINSVSRVANIPSLFVGGGAATLYFCVEYSWDWRYYFAKIMLVYLVLAFVLTMGKNILPKRRGSIEKAAYLLGGEPLKNFIFPEE